MYSCTMCPQQKLRYFWVDSKASLLAVLLSFVRKVLYQFPLIILVDFVEIYFLIISWELATHHPPVTTGLSSDLKIYKSRNWNLEVATLQANQIQAAPPLFHLITLFPPFSCSMIQDLKDFVGLFAMLGHFTVYRLG